jgi:double-strand break repair protein MRE11
MVLLGGDLFHDNKPSRKAMYQVIRSLRKNCLGMKPCELEFLSDATELFEGAFGHVNYEDPDINISIPVFSIHGNHDDPSGDGHFASLDLLQAAGLVNYFGRVPEADNIECKPVLMQKGRSKLALYGLSNVRDERMFRSFRDHKVKFFRPNIQRDDFFNLLAVHQNHHAHTATSYLPERVLPDWLDLVVWGHEHECLIDPVENPETGFRVIQPGSSVATSLIPGEAVTKHVAILSITGREFEVQKIPLATVRPMVCQDLVLYNDKRFKDLAKTTDHRPELARRLEQVVNSMIEQANADWLALQAGGAMEGELEPPLPLIRLKVEFTAPEGENFEVENPQRFSNRFVGKVANTNDVVYFFRKKKSGARTFRRQPFYLVTLTILGRTVGANDAEFEEDISLNVIRVENLVREYLAAQSLKILPQGEFGDAVNQFVNKDDKNAMDTFVRASLANQLRDIIALDPEEDALDDAMERSREQREAKFKEAMQKAHERRQAKRAEAFDSDEENEIDSRPMTRSAAPPDGDDDMFFSDEELPETIPESIPAPKTRRAVAAAKDVPAKAAPKKAASKKAPVRGGRAKKPFLDDSDEDEDMFVDVEEEPPAPVKRQPARATRTKQSTLNFSQASRPTKGTQGSQAQPLEISADEISEEDGFETMPTKRGRRR